ncbi:polysaccharide lyase family 8 super-sandwich domain-containing protein [Pleomorphovibrio marinus]|uniref:polysaccharide lyase family 8 super-sandwich domain-containing protein n=1 Tax=Pleomorphovibrio marinus TaxID=2164132 RepID=UPI000E09F760|nr:polysaccharide lyase family 8 super-sandwich domain-containing protein [Pleomorphovibrio marinus]
MRIAQLHFPFFINLMGGWIILSFLCLPSYAQDEEIALLRQRLLQDALDQKGFVPRVSQYMIPNFKEADEYLGSLSEEGSWQDVDYADRDNEWEPLIALNRILVMAHAFANPKQEAYQKQEIMRGIEKALTFWYSTNPVCDNWYKNRIAKQMYLGVIGLLVRDELDKTLLNRVINDLTEEPSMTGSNRTLLATSVFYRGVLENNPERVRMGVEGVTDQVVMAEGEGVQVDYSFHQHGPYLYNGSYGSNFLRESIWMAAMVQGTSYAFEEVHLALLRNYYWKGTRWMIRKGVLDYNVRGRQVGRPSGFNQRADILVPQLAYLISADPKHEEDLRDSRERIAQRLPQDITGNRHFWRSDYTAHHRDAYFTSLRMCSERTVGVETDVNSENLMGYYLPYGLTYIYRRGDEYENIFPVWDWAKLPGVTNPSEVPVSKGNFTQEVAFVGGVSDGKYGVSAMELQVQATKGKKAWFWFDDEWVALGADISGGGGDRVTTGINQSRLFGHVYMDGKVQVKGISNPQQASWIWHDSVAYVIHDHSTALKLEAKEKSGNLHAVFGLGADTVYQMETFTLYVDHGVMPEDGKYAYTVMPGKTLAQTEEYVRDSPILLLSNTPKVQAVHHTELNLTGIVFYEPGSFQVQGDISLSVNAPCILLFHRSNGDIWISDPSTNLKELKLGLAIGKNEEFFRINMPRGQEAGKSVRVCK